MHDNWPSHGVNKVYQFRMLPRFSLASVPSRQVCGGQAGESAFSAYRNHWKKCCQVP